MDKTESKNELEKLIQKYNSTIRTQNKKNVSEETIRTWLNEMLEIFGWDVKDSTQILQERALDQNLQEKLKNIGSTHTRPDYILINGLNIKTFLDAKSLDVNVFTDSDAAFQIRSYGWSANVPCAFISNFEQLSIYETQITPSVLDDVKKHVLYQLDIDNYMENFDILYNHLNHDLVCSNGLELLYKDVILKGNKSLDESFVSVLQRFRHSIAENLYVNNKTLITTNEMLNYYTQVILDRIVFIRVCESKGIEKLDLLKSFCSDKKGFWKCFKASCHVNFYSHYDGTLFDRDELFEKLIVEDDVLVKLVEQLYYPYPYKFDIIPAKVIASIYEKFLETQLVIKDEVVCLQIKPDYIKTGGAVATPEYIADVICRQTVNLNGVTKIEELLDVKILDPCCGSGVFLISSYELLVNKFVSIIKNNLPSNDKYSSWFVKDNKRIFLTIDARRKLVMNCLYGIDYDEVALEVTKTSLALKVLDGTDTLYWDRLGAYSEKILQDISKNIKLGNSLVPEQASFNSDEIEMIKPLDIKRAFNDVFAKDNGFKYIVCNPPYVETKLYKASNFSMHSYLKNNYKSFENKADLSILFLERAIQLLAEHGRAGFIIQKRWFKAEYGRSIRNIISENLYLDTVLDFSSNNIFKNKQNYVAILILEKNHGAKFNYLRLDDDKNSLSNLFENLSEYERFNASNFTSIPTPKIDIYHQLVLIKKAYFLY